MSKSGTTWFKSKRKLTALVAGAAILAGTIGATAPQPDAELASTWSRGEVIQLDFDKKIDVEVRLPSPIGNPKPLFSFKSTWS